MWFQCNKLPFINWHWLWGLCFSPISETITSLRQAHLSLSCSEFFSMLSFSANSISSRAARPMLTAVGLAEVRWHRDSLMKVTGSSPPAPARSCTARLRQPTMAMAGAPRTWRKSKRTVMITVWSSSLVSMPTSIGSLPVVMRIINLVSPQSLKWMITELKVLTTALTELISSELEWFLSAFRLHYHHPSAYGTFLHSHTLSHSDTLSKV